MAAIRLAVERGLLVTGDRRGPGRGRDAGGREPLPTRRPAAASRRWGSPRRSWAAAARSPSARVQAKADVVSCGGGLRALVDAEAVGLSLVTLERRRLGELRAVVARGLVEAGFATPLEDLLVTGPAHGEADLRVVAVSESGRLDRSPTGEGAAAAVTVLHAIGLVEGDRAVRIEGPSGGMLEARIAERRESDGAPAVAVDVAGTAWLIGEHTWFWDDDDPLGAGFMM